jgi:hypothetical protein
MIPIELYSTIRTAYNLTIENAIALICKIGLQRYLVKYKTSSAFAVEKVGFFCFFRKS